MVAQAPTGIADIYIVVNHYWPLNDTTNQQLGRPSIGQAAARALSEVFYAAGRAGGEVRGFGVRERTWISLAFWHV